MDNAAGYIEEDSNDLDKMHLYIKGGSIIPRKDIGRRSSHSMKFDPFTIVVAADISGQASGELYVDDGESYEYSEQQAYSRISFQATIDFTRNILNLSLDVTGQNHLLAKEGLRANQIVLLYPHGKAFISTELSFTDNASHQILF